MGIETAWPPLKRARLSSSRFSGAQVETVSDGIRVTYADRPSRIGETAALAEATSRLVGQRLTILLDGEVLMKPVIQAAIVGGHGFIAGDPYMTTEQSLIWATDIADRMRAKPLPVRLEAESEKDIN